MGEKDFKDMSLEEIIKYENDRKDIKKKAEPDHTAQNLRQQVVAHGVFMIEKLQNSIYNKDEDLSAEQQMAYDKLWPIIEDLIKQTSDLKKIEAENAADVIKLVGQGKISLEDATKLMAIMHSKADMDDLKLLIEKMESMPDDAV